MIEALQELLTVGIPNPEDTADGLPPPGGIPAPEKTVNQKIFTGESVRSRVHDALCFRQRLPDGLGRCVFDPDIVLFNCIPSNEIGVLAPGDPIVDALSDLLAGAVRIRQDNDTLSLSGKCNLPEGFLGNAVSARNDHFGVNRRLYGPLVTPAFHHDHFSYFHETLLSP